MTTFLYIDYGPSPDTATELKFSLATLCQAHRDRELKVVVYTDKPEVYAALPVRTRDLRPDFAAWSREKTYAHRVKTCVLIDALGDIDTRCVLLDSDTFVRPGFADALAATVGGVAMDHFERVDPYPAAAGFAAELPGLGRYAYSGAATRMYNSGLVAAEQRHAPMLQQALALIDALLDKGLNQFNIEQIAVSEAFRLNGEPIAEMKPWFEHYYRRSQKLFMRPRIARLFAKLGGWRPLFSRLEPSKFNVRAAHIFARLRRGA